MSASNAQEAEARLREEVEAGGSPFLRGPALAHVGTLIEELDRLRDGCKELENDIEDQHRELMRLNAENVAFLRAAHPEHSAKE